MKLRKRRSLIPLLMIMPLSDCELKLRRAPIFFLCVCGNIINIGVSHGFEQRDNNRLLLNLGDIENTERGLLENQNDDTDDDGSFDTQSLLEPVE